LTALPIMFAMPHAGSSLVLVLAVVFSMTGCVLVDAERVAATRSPEEPFARDLFLGYVNLARRRSEQGHPLEESLFAYKADAAAHGDVVAPEKVSDWSIPEGDVDRLQVARERLIISLIESRRAAVPSRGAEAQVMFDCWLTEISDDRESHEAKDCRDRFWRALGSLEGH